MNISHSQVMNISLSQADAAIAAARSAANAIGIAVNIVVLDAGVHLKASARMDGAFLGSIDVAFGKARTAALFGISSEAVGEFCKPGSPSQGLERTNGGLVVFGGGLPIHDKDGQLIGTVGVSGGSVDQDVRIAKAAVEAVQTA